ncbi:MAG: 2-oxoacid:acceptor oxidoreductase family protein [Planctomycetes bacterium]|nr:2-oxoacid:acceptor oxidoreductase family protein [Planctomycetota bacterium]
MEERILIAGAGGQGALTIGKFVARVGMEKHRVTYFPSYGAEVRGGTAHCHVVISDSEIATPVVEEATVLVLMNQMSYDRFAERLNDDGLMLLNSSMIETDGAKPRGRVVGIPASQLAGEMGDIRVANMILTGALNHYKQIMDEAGFLAVMQEMLGKEPSKVKLFDLNKTAFRIGAEQAAKLG